MNITLDHYVSILNQVEHPILLCDPEQNVIFLNQRASELFELDPPLKRKPFLQELMMFKDATKPELQTAFSSTQPSILEAYLLNQEDPGEVILYKLIINPTGRGSSKTYCVQIKELESFSLSSDKIRLIGKKTGDLAHAISNPLAVIKLNCETVQLFLKQDLENNRAKIEQKVEKIALATDKVTDETKNLKKLAMALTDLNTDELIQITGPSKSGDKSDEFH